MVVQWLERWLSTLETVSLVGHGSSVVGALALNIRDYLLWDMVVQWLERWLSTIATVSLVGHGSSVVGALALNIRDCVSCGTW